MLRLAVSEVQLSFNFQFLIYFVLLVVYQSKAPLTVAQQLSPKRSFFHRAKHFHRYKVAFTVA